MPDTYQLLLDSLKQDHESGSIQLAVATLRGLYNYLNTKSELTINRLSEMTNELKAARNTMVVFPNAIERWQLLWQQQNSDFKKTYLDSLLTVINQLTDASQKTAENALELIKPGMTIMTHSRSSLVMKLFELAAQQRLNIKVIQTISIPGNEGLLAAQQLNQLAIPVTLIPDTQIGLMMPQTDLVVCGCDSWLTDHHFVNKTGTLLLALAAQMHQKPLWVLADSFKNSHERHDELPLETLPLDALNLPQGPYISTKNTCFESVPTRLIAGRIDENAIQPML